MALNVARKYPQRERLRPVVQVEPDFVPPPIVRTNPQTVQHDGPRARALSIQSRRQPGTLLPSLLLFIGAAVLLFAIYQFQTSHSFSSSLAVASGFPEQKELLLPEPPLLLGRRSGGIAVERGPDEHVALGVITTSFAAAAAKGGIPAVLVDDLVDLFSDRVAFDRDFQPGDRFSIIYRKRPGDSPKEVSYEVLGAALEVNGEHLTAARYVGTDGKARFFDEGGKPIGNTFLRYPVQFSRITSAFSESRFHPVLRVRRPHNGVDFSAPTGTPVRAVAAGRITFAGRRGPNGIMVQLDHGDRWSTAYLHLSKLASGVRSGSTVSKGQVIGAVGATGLATGPHLHYSLFDRGKYVDPLKTKLPLEEFLDKGRMISRKYLERVLLTLHHYQNVDLAKLAQS